MAKGTGVAPVQYGFGDRSATLASPIQMVVKHGSAPCSRAYRARVIASIRHDQEWWRGGSNALRADFLKG